MNGTVNGTTYAVLQTDHPAGGLQELDRIRGEEMNAAWTEEYLHVAVKN